MEKLKSVVPDALKHLIAESTPDDLTSTSSSLLHFFHQLPQFHQIVRDLTDPETALCRKNKDAALESKRKGNECFSEGDYFSALRFYSQALRVAPTDADDKDKNLVAMLYVNRASVLHKMGHVVECLRDSNRALIISQSYAKAWYRRGKANASLGNYEDVVRDLNIAMNMEQSLGGKRQIESELKLMLGQHNGPRSSLDKFNENGSAFLDETHQIKLQCVSTPTKGRGMASLTDIPQAALIHTEEPYAAVILKHCRETHCHFCFSELPVDTVPCFSCSIPLYCSRKCQVQAGGQGLENDPKNHGILVNLSVDLEKYISDIISSSFAGSYIECIAEHRHECQGVHWSAVLPSEIVLAGRVLVRLIEQQRDFGAVPSFMGNLDLCHNYIQLPSESKLELHLYSIFLLYCLHHSCGSKFPIDGFTISQCILLQSQIKVNSMAIVHMKFSGVNRPLEQSRKFSNEDALTNSIEQVRVGQAIYSAGSLFNHSCEPNIHSYFLSRILYIRSTEFVAAGNPLELSYGPQVGQWDCKDRQKFLKDQYSFRCQCSGCSKLNLADLVLNAFRCVKLNCFGVVLDGCVAKYEIQKVNTFLEVPTICGSEAHMQVDKLKKDDINKVAHVLFEQTGWTRQFEPGYCLSCGSYCDLGDVGATVNEAATYIRRLEDAIVYNEVQTNTILDALRSLELLRSMLHAYNKKIAEVEDNLAHAFCLVGEPEPARDHCEASIEILEKLYGPNHIVIGNELVKLASIQLYLGDRTAVDSINRMGAVLSQYYGSHAEILFPYLQTLKREACKLIQ